MTTNETAARAQQRTHDETKALLAARRPAWAQALIVAELEHDKSDGMTDYFNTDTSRIVALAWSKHTKDVFSEMRKAAAKFSETAHLGSGRDLYTARVVLTEDVISGGSGYWKDSPSHWHAELYGDDDRARYHGKQFSTREEAEAFTQQAGEPHPIEFQTKDGPQLVHFAWRIGQSSIEHREKYSMGHGYYLKASSRYSDGWIVRKVSSENIYKGIELDVLGGKPAAPTAAPTTGQEVSQAVTMTLNPEHQGVELRFPEKPAEAVLTRLKLAGWRWTRFNACWYQKDTPFARRFAEALQEEFGAQSVSQ